MHSVAPLYLFALLCSVAALDDEYTPFSNPLFGRSDDELLVKRQNNCQSGYNSCSGLGGSGACCPNGQNCALDQAGNVACCPTSAYCTGVISGTIAGSATTRQTGGSGVIIGTTTVGPSTITSNSAVLPSSGVAGGGSTVPNAPYPFVFLPTSYENADLCLSAYTYCQSESTACAASLGGVNGVTVSGNGGGITVQGAGGTTFNPASASSICSSLSQQACYGIVPSNCGTGATASTTGTFIQPSNHGPRQTACAGVVYAAGAGAMVGLGALL